MVSAASQPLEVYEIWSGEDGAATGNIVAVNTECRTGSAHAEPSTLHNDACPSPDFLHGCDTEGGSSGSPVFLSGTNTIVGIHFGGVSREIGNCAVSIAAVRKDMGM